MNPKQHYHFIASDDASAAKPSTTFKGVNVTSDESTGDPDLDTGVKNMKAAVKDCLEGAKGKKISDAELKQAINAERATDTHKPIKLKSTLAKNAISAAVGSAPSVGGGIKQRATR